MAEKNRLDRRAFLRNAGIGVLVSAVGSHTAVEAGVPPLVLPQDAGYDFDTVYDRIGTDCSKWDAQIARYGHIDVGMGTEPTRTSRSRHRSPRLCVSVSLMRITGT